ncbi:MAG: hypothetical protein ACYC2Y_04045 [Armatimonadota bacterium]
MRDSEGTVVYIGKAIDLRRRVASYCTPSAARDRRIQRLVLQVDSLSYVETWSELEALLVESRLIKSFLPAFNRRLTEPESSCFLTVDFDETLPRIEIAPSPRGSSLGPFWRSALVEDALETVSDAFLLRRCTGTPARPCMYLELGRCSGPCRNPDGYEGRVRAAWDVLSGKSAGLVRQLVRERDLLSGALRFEEAARKERRIRALAHIRSARSIPEGFAVIVPSRGGGPVLLVFARGRLVAKSQLGVNADCREIAGVLDAEPEADLLPGRASRDDLLIIRSYLAQRNLSNLLVPTGPDAAKRLVRGIKKEPRICEAL